MITTKLLTIPSRQHTILPELVKFFTDNGGDDANELLHAFLKSFAGTNFLVPDPSVLAEMRRDEEILRQLGREPSIDDKIALLKQYKINYDHLKALWGCLHDRPMTTPCNGLEAAAKLMRKHPGQRADIGAMYGIREPDQRRLVAASKPKKAVPR